MSYKPVILAATNEKANRVMKIFPDHYVFSVKSNAAGIRASAILLTEGLHPHQEDVQDWLTRLAPGAPVYHLWET